MDWTPSRKSLWPTSSTWASMCTTLLPRRPRRLLQAPRPYNPPSTRSPFPEDFSWTTSLLTTWTHQLRPHRMWTSTLSIRIWNSVRRHSLLLVSVGPQRSAVSAYYVWVRVFVYAWPSDFTVCLLARIAVILAFRLSCFCDAFVFFRLCSKLQTLIYSTDMRHHCLVDVVAWETEFYASLHSSFQSPLLVSSSISMLWPTFDSRTFMLRWTTIPRFSECDGCRSYWIQ